MAYYPDAIGEAFNLGSQKEIRILDLANWVNKLTGNKAGIIFRKRRNWDKKQRARLVSQDGFDSNKHMCR